MESFEQRVRDSFSQQAFMFTLGAELIANFKTASILVVVLKSTDPIAAKSAVGLINELGRRGFHEYRDLIELGPNLTY